ncbi:MAG: hypothetical protein R3D60_09770 [Paracoccaceae bacterium]
MRKIAVVVIHGMGKQTKKGDPEDSTSLSFSRGMRDAIEARLGVERMRDVTWREIFWQEILETRQSDLSERMEPIQHVGFFRKLILSYIGDGANFAYSPRPESTYQRVHARIRAALDSARAEAGDDAPLVILAHSLGGHMMSTYLWDNNPRSRDGEPPHPPATETPAEAFMRGGTLAALVTFGCNIPVFAFAHDDVKAIDPRRWATAGYLRPTWWHNFFSPADGLSFPLGPTGGEYFTLANPGPQDQPAQLQDWRVVVGGLLTAWNIGSHSKYWTASDLIGPTSAILRQVQGTGG